MPGKLDPETLNPDGDKAKGPLARLRPAKPDAGPKPERKAPTMSRAKLEQELGGLLTGINLGLMMIPPLAADQLTEAEIVILSRGLVDQAERSARFKGWLVAAVRSGGGFSLFAAVGLIAGRRAVRHGILPGVPAEIELRAELDLRLAAAEEMIADPKAAAALFSAIGRGAPAAEPEAAGEVIFDRTAEAAPVPAVGRPRKAKTNGARAPEAVAPGAPVAEA